MNAKIGKDCRQGLNRETKAHYLAKGRVALIPTSETAVKLYVGIDLHLNNNTVVVINEQDQVIYRQQLNNELTGVLQALEPFRAELAGVVVESTYNWYWLVDGLEAAGYPVHLANTTAIQQYSGLKYSDDSSDATWLAHLLRLGLLLEGHIYPKQTRAVRDLLRKRGQLVRQRTGNILSIENLTSRNQGIRMTGNAVKKLSAQEVDSQYENPDLALAVTSTLSIVDALNGQIEKIEKRVKEKIRLAPSFEGLKTVSGIGDTLALTIMLEAGNPSRFPSVGDFSSYCRCVSSQKLSNGKKKGSGNVKNGNAYLSWAFIEAAHFAIRHDPVIRRFYQRKKAKTLSVVALKAVAHKLARACYYVMRDQVPFEVEKCFGH
jgi:transposase